MHLFVLDALSWDRTATDQSWSHNIFIFGGLSVVEQYIVKKIGFLYCLLFFIGVNLASWWYITYTFIFWFALKRSRGHTNQINS